MAVDLVNFNQNKEQYRAETTGVLTFFTNDKRSVSANGSFNGRGGTCTTKWPIPSPTPAGCTDILCALLDHCL